MSDCGTDKPCKDIIELKTIIEQHISKELAYIKDLVIKLDEKLDQQNNRITTMEAQNSNLKKILYVITTFGAAFICGIGAWLIKG
jgi:hypothetical protein